jgi:hypothetical protein
MQGFIDAIMQATYNNAENGGVLIKMGLRESRSFEWNMKQNGKRIKQDRE